MDKVFSKKLRHFKSSDFARGIEFATENPISVHLTQSEANVTDFYWYPWDYRQHFRVELRYDHAFKYGYFSLIPVFRFDDEFVEPMLYGNEGVAPMLYKKISLNDFFRKVQWDVKRATFQNIPSELYPNQEHIVDLVMHIGNHTIRRTYSNDSLKIMSVFHGDPPESTVRNESGVDSVGMTITPVITKNNSPNVKIERVSDGTVFTYRRDLIIHH